MASLIISSSASSTHHHLTQKLAPRHLPDLRSACFSGKLGIPKTRVLSVVTRAGPSSSSYIYAFVFPLSLLAVTIFTSIRIADRLDKKFLEELAINQAILEEDEEEGDVNISLEEEPALRRTRNGYGPLMAEKKSWFNLLKRLFLSEAHSKPDKKEKRRRWMFGRLKIKRLASMASPSRERNLCEAEEEQNKHAVTVAIATAAAAEAAVAAAQAAAEREIRDLAAIKIQTAFRGYLARKALRALKGLVRLQAIIRGRAVRRQTINTLKCLQSIVNIQSQVCARRCQMEGTLHCHENKKLQDFREKEIKIDSNSQTRRDGSILSKEEVNALFSSKRERIKEYALSHRRSAESEQNKLNGRWRYGLEQWVDTQLAKREELKTSEPVFSSSARNREEFVGRQLKQRNSPRQCYLEGLDSPITGPRRSFHHRKQRSIGDDNTLGSSSVVPTYMAATESAKAKARSWSSPRLRPVSFDAYSETNSPYKHKLSPASSINSEVICSSSNRIGNSGFQQRSPCLKRLPGPLKSNRTLKDLSFDSECSLPNWDRHDAFR
ncbi:hypothetical protein F0562_027016 [Nyssa sinensis]|uniref:DUF4005 domain-containing protein n=1 Tax=Nyssa sinensis TaxID=561372 RepID=A0A5J5B6B7_9ASTE|nr:hypothetical protein F0562_027016 [Nyssa sinensis]